MTLRALESGRLGLWLVSSLLLVGCGERLDTQAARLHARCEVHLEELRRPIIDLASLVSPLDPEDVCELHLFSYDEAGRPVGEMVESGNWSASCPPVEECDDQERGCCTLEIEPRLINQYEDGVLLCRPGDVGRCDPPQEGLRTVCRVRHPAEGDLWRDVADLGTASNQVEGEPGERGLVTSAVLAVDSLVDDDPDDDIALAAVTTMVSSLERSWIATTWVEADLETGGLAPLGEPVDLCEACQGAIAALAEEAPEILGAPAYGFVGIQTAVRDQSVLLAGACGARAVLEVGREGECQAHRVLPSSTAEEPAAPSPQVVLGVTELAGEAGHYLALWTDGLALYSTHLEPVSGDLVPQAPSFLSDTLETQSREDARAICVCLRPEDVECREASCVTLWTEVTRFGRQELLGEADAPLPPDDFGDREVHYDFLGPGLSTGVRALSAQSMGDGYAGQIELAFPLDDFVFDGTIDLEGIFVDRSVEYGVQARSWNAAAFLDIHSLTEIDLTQVDLQVSGAVSQLATARETSAFDLTHATPRALAVAFWERQQAEPFGLRVAFVGLREQEQPELFVTQGQLDESFSLTHPLCQGDEGRCGVEPPQPLIEKNAFPEEDLSEHRLLLVASAPDEVGRCMTHLGLFDTDELNERPINGHWPLEEPLVPIAVESLETPGACEPGCRGDIAWTRFQYLLALPGVGGPTLLSVRLGEAGGSTIDYEEIEIAAGLDLPLHDACRIDLSTNRDSLIPQGYIFFDRPTSGAVERQRLSAARLLVDDTLSGWAAEQVALQVNDPVQGLVDPENLSSPTSPEVITVPAFTVSPPSMLAWSEHRFGDWRQLDFVIGRVAEETPPSTTIVLEPFPFNDQSVIDSRAVVASAAVMPFSGDVTDVDRPCSLVSYSRPDLSSFQDVVGYHRITSSTPLVETVFSEIGRPYYDDDDEPEARLKDDRCALCQSIELFEGGQWRGLPTDLLVFRELVEGVPRLAPVEALSKAAPAAWAAGQATAFAFLEVGLDDRAVQNDFWAVEELEPRWATGDSLGEQNVAAMRLALARAEPADVIGAAWTATRSVGAGQREGTTFFNLVSPDLSPLTAGFPVHSARSPEGVEERAVLVNDARLLVAEHLDAAVAALDPTHFIVAWSEASWSSCPGDDPEADGGVDGGTLDPSCERHPTSVSFGASQVVCEVVQSRQILP